MRYLTVLLLLYASLSASAKSIVQDPQALKNAVLTAKPGDTIVLKNKEWKNAALILTGRGTAAKPVVIMPESPGGVVLTGNSFLQLSGEYLKVMDLHFNNGYTPKREVISFRVDNKNLANHCQVSGIVIENYSQPERFKGDTWVTLYGKHNRVDHCTFVNKLNLGPVIIAELDDERSQMNYHLIDNNYFKGRQRFGSNGGETIRIGVSRYSLTASRTNIMHNLFEHCNGEVEIVSIKSGENRVAFNTFYESEGSVVLRHGSNNIIEGNFFIGNNKPFTGGVRIINPGHKVFNNVFYKLQGSQFRAPLSIMYGVPNSLINRYYQVKDVTIDKNTFIDCAALDFGAGKDAERTLAPENVLFKNNLILAKDKSFYENATDGTQLVDNSLKENVRYVLKNGYNLPFDSKYGANIKSLQWIQKEKTGASWYKPAVIVAARKERRFLVNAGQSENMAGIVQQALSGDTIVLVDTGYYKMNMEIAINKTLFIMAAENLRKRPVLVNASYNSMPSFFTIENGGRLTVKNLAFKGTFESFSNAEAGVRSTDKPMNRPYFLNVDGCEFYDFNESSQSGIAASKGTLADSLLVSNSIFHHISGYGINLAAEKEDKGIYNAENVIINNCVFTNLLGSAINIYRGGNDESTLGPFVTISHCSFNEVDNREQGAAVKLIGVQHAKVTNSSFSYSGQGGRSIQFQEYRWDKIIVDYCNFYKSGKIDSFYDKVSGPHHYSEEPGSQKLLSASDKQQPLGAQITL